MQQNGKRGFALISVLVIMLILTFMSAVIMDLTLNSHSMTMEMIQGKKLYNAAQSGIEWGMAMLLENRDVLDEETKTGISGITFDPDNASQINAIRATISSGDILDQPQPPSALFPPNISVTVDILDCNYSPPLNYDAVLPPLRESVSSGGGGGGSATPPEGTSVIVDPSRLMTFGGGSGVVELAFVVRSRASTVDRSVSLETMVVISR